MTAPRVLVVGGYGVVGRQIAMLVSSRNPEIELWIGGRSLQSACDCAARLENATGVRIDVDDTDPLDGLPGQPDLIVGAANDRDDRLLLATARRGIAYVDITRWTPRLLTALERLATAPLAAPAVMASGWMAGVAATIAAHCATDLGEIDSIDIDILYAVKDKAGPNSIEYADQLNIPFIVREDGRSRLVRPLTEPRPALFSGGRERACYRFDTPDQYSLVDVLGARGASTRLSYDDPAAVRFMRLMIGSGVWKLLSRPMFRRIRHAILYNPGEGGAHEFIVSVRGRAPDGRIFARRSSVVDPLGQTHLTAAGAAMQVERLLGLRGRIRPPAGVSFPEQARDLDAAVAALGEMGVSIAIDPE